GERGCRAPVSLRVNPDVDAKTHPYISTGLKENKFGISHQDARRIYRIARDLPHLQVVGIDCHIGSQLTELAPFLDALDRLLLLIDALAEDGIHLRHVDVGGGLGVRYDSETPPQPAEYAAALLAKLAGRPELELVFEPGRAIVANAGVMLTRVEYLKASADRNFAIVDAGMNDLLRPALYQAWMQILPADRALVRPSACYDVVGPVCETSDFLGKQRELAIAQGDLLVVRSAGAYGFSMSSNYNSRPRAAEVLVDGTEFHLIRERETLSDLWRGEHLLP
ncbi:MAG: diaminopimelate decarboxylase, partial [Plesiomonas shigelloides]